MLRVTGHGNPATYHKITGFNMREETGPAINLSAEFSAISLGAYLKQKVKI